MNRRYFKNDKDKSSFVDQKIPSDLINMQLAVVVGVILKKETQEILFSFRQNDRPQGGYWEFPGGKVLTHENAFKALQREMNEELGIKVLQAKFLKEICYLYEQTKVSLSSWVIDEYDDEVSALEKQKIVWIGVDNLSNIRLTRPNSAVLAAFLSTI